MSRKEFSHIRGAASAVGIFLYFAFFTAWVPSALLRSSYLASASDFVQQLLIGAVWGGFFVAGLVGLRVAQRRELI